MWTRLHKRTSYGEISKFFSKTAGDNLHLCKRALVSKFCSTSYVSWTFRATATAASGFALGLAMLGGDGSLIPANCDQAPAPPAKLAASYDFVVVGAGVAGISALFGILSVRPGSRILVVDSDADALRATLTDPVPELRALQDQHGATIGSRRSRACARAPEGRGPVGPAAAGRKEPAAGGLGAGRSSGVGARNYSRSQLVAVLGNELAARRRETALRAGAGVPVVWIRLDPDRTALSVKIGSCQQALNIWLSLGNRNMCSSCVRTPSAAGAQLALSLGRFVELECISRPCRNGLAVTTWCFAVRPRLPCFGLDRILLHQKSSFGILLCEAYANYQNCA